MPTPPASADAAHNLFIASICRRWRRLAQRCVTALLVKEDRVVSHRDVLNAVACFPSLTHLHLSDGSVETLDDAFLADLARSCPGLRALHVGKLIEAVGLYRRNDRVITESGLDFFFRHCPQLEQLSLQCLEENLNPPASFFQLQHLSALSLTTPFILNPLNLSSLSYLTAVSIETSPLHYEQLSTLLHLTNLTHLSLPSIRRASPNPPAFSLAQLPSLESLKLGLWDVDFSVFFPLGSSYRCLKRLQVMSGSTPQADGLPNSIGEVLPRLQELSISRCRRLRDLTDQLTSLACLERLTITSCNVSTLPDNFGNLPALKALVLHWLPLLRLPVSFTRLASLETLLLVGCEKVEELPAGFGCLTALRTLSLADVPTLHLPEDKGGLTNLHTFHLKRNGQGQLPTSFTQLVSLTRLELDGCEIAKLPEGMAAMTNLQEIYIQNFSALKELPEFLTALVSLQVLRIQECCSLSSVPRRLDSLTRLKELELRECRLLIEAPEALPLSLQALSYTNNRQGASLADIATLATLTELRKLCLGIVSAACLEAIGTHLSRVEHLELMLGDDAGVSLSALTRLPRLRTLALGNVRSVNRLVESDGPALQELRQLNIHFTRDEVTELPAAITTLHHLTSLDIYAPWLSSLPDAIGAFSRLRKLDLSQCLSVTRLPASLTQLSCLHELNVSNTCIRLLPAGFVQLSRLKKLDISDIANILPFHLKPLHPVPGSGEPEYATRRTHCHLLCPSS
ncbi:unnamed protein product [Closterium sp. NIES-65]|nr:unnamed protein product [Closterium sp. NIES-65]